MSNIEDLKRALSAGYPGTKTRTPSNTLKVEPLPIKVESCGHCGKKDEMGVYWLNKNVGRWLCNVCDTKADRGELIKRKGKIVEVKEIKRDSQGNEIVPFGVLFKRLMWPSGTIALGIMALLLAIFVPIGIKMNKEQAKKETSQKYVKRVTPEWVIATYGKRTFVKYGPKIPKIVREGINDGLYDVLGVELYRNFGLYAWVLPWEKDVDLKKENAVILLVKRWTGEHCLNPDIHFADLAKGEGADGGDAAKPTFVMRLCIDKAYRVVRSQGVIPGYDKKDQSTLKIIKGWFHKSEKKFWKCVGSHETGHRWWYVHPMAWGLMSEGGGACELHKHELNIFRKTVLPHIQKKEQEVIPKGMTPLLLPPPMPPINEGEFSEVPEDLDGGSQKPRRPYVVPYNPPR